MTGIRRLLQRGRAAMQAAAPWVMRFPTHLQVAGLGIMFVAWALTSPLASVPDEPAHIVKAASVWQGQLRGETVPLNPEQLPLEITGERLRAPGSYVLSDDMACFAFRPTVPATCQPGLSTDDEIATKPSAAGPYAPTYYALVGWPSRVVDASVGIYLMRLTTAAACTVLAGLALVSLRRHVGATLAFTAVAVAVTPMVAYLAGSVNPNGLEIVGALACWAGISVCIGDAADGHHPRRIDIVTGLVGAAVLALTRALGPLFTVAIVVAVLVAHGRDSLRIVTLRPVVRLLGAVAGAVVMGGAWVLGSGQLSTLPGDKPVPGQPVIQQLVAKVDNWVEQMIAVFGWLDTGPVRVAVWAWLSLVAVLVAVAWLFGSGWRAIWTVCLLAFVVVAPVVLQYPGADDQGIAWQGRYGLPLAVGIPVMAALALRGGMPATLQRRLVPVVAALVVIGHLVAFVAAMRRYAVGNAGPIRFWRAPGAWSPPLGNVVVIGLFLLSLALLALGALAATRATPDSVDRS